MHTIATSGSQGSVQADSGAGAKCCGWGSWNEATNTLAAVGGKGKTTAQGRSDQGWYLVAAAAGARCWSGSSGRAASSRAGLGASGLRSERQEGGRATAEGCRKQARKTSASLIMFRAAGEFWRGGGASHMVVGFRYVSQGDQPTRHAALNRLAGREELGKLWWRRRVGGAEPSRCRRARHWESA